MAVAPLTTDQPTQDTTVSSAAPAPATLEPQPAPVNPTPVAPPPVTVSNVQTHASDSAQTAPPQGGIVGRAAAGVESSLAKATTAANAVSPAPASTSQPATTAAPQPKPANPLIDLAVKTKAKNAVAAKSALDIQAEALASTPDTIKKMLEGDDPIATREFNMLINQVGPKNQLAMEGYGMKLRQQNLDGQGAGNALLEMMARDQGYDTDQLIAKIGADSAQRLYDLNQWGFSKANEIFAQQDKIKHDNLDLALKNGQYDQAASIWGEIFPGVSFDIGAAKALDPNQQALFASRSKLIQTFIDQGDADGAKKAMLSLAQDNPEAFGFKTSEEAVAALQGVDFSKETWANNQTFTNQVNEAIRTAALQGDRTSAMSAIDRYYANMIPGSADREGKAALGSMSLDDINAVLKANDKSAVTQAEVSTISPDEFAKDKKFYDEKVKASGANGVDLMLKQITDIHPEIGMDPDLRNAARAWIFDNVSGFNINPDGTSLDGFTFKENASLPPWDPNSLSGHLYTTWPVASFNDDGTVKQGISAGGAPYTKDNPRGDLTTPLGRETANIDANWEQYVMKTRSDPSTRMTRDQWYYATKGGSQVDPIASVDAPQVGSKVDPTTGVTTTTAIDPLTGKPTTTTTPPDNIASVLSGMNGQAGLNAYLADHPDGAYVSVSQDGKTVAKVTGVLRDSGTSANGTVIELQAANGKKVYYDPGNAQYMAITDTPTKVGNSGLFGTGIGATNSTVNMPTLNGGKTYNTFAEALAQA